MGNNKISSQIRVTLVKNLGKKTALILEENHISYNDMISSSRFIFSKYLEGKNYSKVSIFMENKPLWFYIYYSSIINESIAVPIDHMAEAEDVSYILNDCSPEIIFTSKENESKLRTAVESVENKPIVVVIDQLEEFESSTEAEDIVINDIESVAVIIYTSGTTGTPKGVMLSYDNLLSNMEAVTDLVPIYKPDDRVLLILPLHHIFPLAGGMLVMMYIGATTVFAPSLNSQDIIDTLKKHKITLILGVPRFYKLIANGIKSKIDKNKIAKILLKISSTLGSTFLSKIFFRTVHKNLGGNIKFMVSGGAALGKDTADFLKALGIDVLEGFGMSEASPMISFTRPNAIKPGSVGHIIPSGKVKICEDGEIAYRGRNVMIGYYNRPEETAEVIKDGWLHTGDLGYLDKDEFLYITGRKKEIIILPNGKNINPEEIENKLLNLSSKIKELAVVQKKNLLAVIIHPEMESLKREGVADIKEYFKNEVIDLYNKKTTQYKKIRDIYIINEDLPRTRLSKLKRYELSKFIDKKRATENIKENKEESSKEQKIIYQFLESQSGQTIMPDDHLEIDIGLDSLDKINLQAFVKNSFGIDLKEKELVENSTARKLSDYIANKKKFLNEKAVDWNKILKEKTNTQLPKSWFLHGMIKYAAKILLFSYFRLSAKGVKNLPESPFILAPNHQSYIDGLFVAVFLKNVVLKKTYFYAKEKHVRSKWIKFIANNNNVIVVDLNKDLKLSLQKMAKVLSSGRNIIIFPEGTRTDDGSVGNFKKTFAILSRELDVPIVPVAINGAYNAMPKGSIIPKPFKKITVEFLDPVYPKDHDYNTLQDEVKTKIIKSIES
ncbi:MAG: long-chain fatty acid--CoA ligase [Candidatus Delongbacteria bacterium]|nr:MAG: long-chain fatty acid--CoA ligase [Candidatus Delongbacteria bacterium]